MKKLIIINGTMAAGKTSTCERLYKRLENSVWLDGDWCWMMNPFVPNAENKQMVQENIIFLLRQYLTNSSFKYVIFNWVIHREEIFDLILTGLRDHEFELYKITLLCSPESLRARALAQGRSQEAIDRAIARLPLYQKMDTIKIDTSNLAIEEVVDEIIRVLEKE